MPNTFTSNTFASTYKDDYKDSDNYYRVLFNSGRALQARELTQLQSIIQGEISRVGRHLFKEGAAVNPGGVTVNNQYEFIKLDTTTNTLPATPSDLVGVELTSTSGIAVRVLEAIEAEGSDPATLFVAYTNTSSGTSGTTPIRVASGEDLSGGGYTLTVQSTDTPSNPATGAGTKASVHAGDFFAQGRFIFLAEQSKIISKYSTTPTEVVGFKIIQDIVTASDTDALYDNQGATPNLASPGADRYRIRGVIDVESNIDSDENFIAVANISNGKITSQVTGVEDYNKINDVLALRTKEESGNYIAKQFTLNYETNDSDTSKLDLIIGPGTAYVDGYRAHTADETILTIDKPRSTVAANSEAVAVSYGSFFVCNGNRSLPDIETFDTVDLRSATAYGGSTIGTAKVRHVLEDNGNYNVYLFDISMNSGQNKRSIRSLGNSVTDYFDVVLDNGNAVLKEDIKNSLLFKLPNSRPQSLTDITLTTQRRFTATTNASGEATISLSASGETFADTTLWIMSAADSDASGPNISAGGAGSTTATLDNGPASTALDILAYVRKGSGSVRTKTLYETTETVASDSVGDVLLSNPDIYEFVRIADSDSDGDVVSNIYDADNGQRQNYYGLGKLHLISGNTAPTNVFVRYKYFDHGASGDFFAKNSYNGQVAYEDIPSFTLDNGTIINLRDYLDFRPVVNSSGTFGSGAIINELPRPGSIVSTDATYYKGKNVSIVINRNGVLTAVEGEQALTPQYPAVPNDSIKLFDLSIGAYTVSDTDITSKRISHKRYTMADIGRIEQRVSRVEEATSLSLLELKTESLNVLDGSGNIRTKSGFFVDNFADNLRGWRVSRDHKASIDAEKKRMRPRYDQSNFRFVYDSDHVENSNVKKRGDYVLLDYSETSFLKNEYITGWENVNPFAVVTHRGMLELSPSSDNWHRVEYINDADPIIDTTVTGIDEFTPQEQELWNSWEWNWTGQQVGDQVFQDVETVGRDQTTTTFTVSNIFLNEPERIEDKIVQQPVTDSYMRSRKIYFRARGMRPNSQLFAFFGNTSVADWVREEPYVVFSDQDSDYSTGYENITEHPDTPSTLITDGAGEVTGSFWLPNTDTLRFPVGTKQFKLFDISTPNENNSLSFAQTPYSSVGTFEIRQRRYTQTRTVEIESETSTTRSRKQFDPLAQSFFVEDINGVYITAVKLRFRSKPDIGPVVVQIRPMVNGHPSSTEILPGSTVFKNPGSVNTSTDGTAITTFQFDEPVYLNGETEYAIVVLTDSNEYEVYVAEAGAFILGSTELRVRRQPTLGSLFKSQNGTTWEPDQTKDMTFELMRADFESSGSIILENINVPTTQLPEGSFQTTNGSADVYVKYRQHGFQVGDKVYITGASTVGGISAGNINGAERSITAVDGTGFKFTAGASATSSTTGGGRPNIERQALFNAIYPAIASVLPSGCTINYSIKTTSGKSLAGSENDYVKETSYSPMFANKTNYFNTVRLIASKRNMTANVGAGTRSLTVKIDIATTDSRVSPLIDMQRATFTAIINRIDDQSVNTPITSVAETEPFGGSHIAKWLTVPVQLEEDAKGIKAIVAANRPSTTDFDVYYRTNGGGGNMFETDWTLVTTEGTKPPTDDNPAIFRDYEYLIGGESGTLDDFTQFQLKIVMKSTNQAQVPVFQDLRMIALTA